MSFWLHRFVAFFRMNQQRPPRD